MSGVFGIIDTPPPLHPESVSSPRGEGGGGNISEDARHWIGLLQYNPSTVVGMGSYRREGFGAKKPRVA